jgi:hypothetical protein
VFGTAQLSWVLGDDPAGGGDGHKIDIILAAKMLSWEYLVMIINNKRLLEIREEKLSSS